MKWVQKNIESFGGDKDAVTIMGYSAGGWSVTLHMVSPMSKGLFHKAVASSGSFIGNWPIPKHQMGLAKRQANVLGCPDSSSEIIMDCLKNKTGQEIGTSSDQLFVKNMIFKKIIISYFFYILGLFGKPNFTLVCCHRRRFWPGKISSRPPRQFSKKWPIK